MGGGGGEVDTPGGYTTQSPCIRWVSPRYERRPKLYCPGSSVNHFAPSPEVTYFACI